MNDNKSEENRLRRAAERQGLGLSKSRRRDKRALDYGRWTLFNLADDIIVVEGDLDKVRNYLEGESDSL